MCMLYLLPLPTHCSYYKGREFLLKPMTIQEGRKCLSLLNLMKMQVRFQFRVKPDNSINSSRACICPSRPIAWRGAIVITSSVALCDCLGESLYCRVFCTTFYYNTCRRRGISGNNPTPVGSCLADRKAVVYG